MNWSGWGRELRNIEFKKAIALTEIQKYTSQI
jgi:hypothetical protein